MINAAETLNKELGSAKPQAIDMIRQAKNLAATLGLSKVGNRTRQ